MGCFFFVVFFFLYFLSLLSKPGAGECIRALWQFGWQGEIKGVILSTSNTSVQLGG